ncbi:MAG TPA: isoprenylcysteine carboxylmethyltransferase family protein [Vicinamibacterales bacterium]|nr:isoprenylcysteine carboxylmethyltransferase family protein [Vicinamibacterales bacterium]
MADEDTLVTSGSPPAGGLTRLAAWLGGAAFAGSLAYCARFLAVTLQQSAPWTGTGAAVRAVVVDLGLFGLFAVHHSLLARPALKSRLAAAVGSKRERPLYVWSASLLLVLTCAAWQSVPGAFPPVAEPAAWLLRVVEAAGILLTAVSARVIDPLELAGIRQLDQPEAHAPIQARGPYRWVRHPIYLGWMLFVFAAPHLTMNRLLFAVVSSAYLVVAIPWEERSLVRTFGEEYRAYQRRVRWRVVPGVY